MDLLKKPIFSYIGMIIAVAAIALGVFKPEWSSIAWSIAGFLGFGSVASLRAAIDSEGWKTYAVFGIVIVILVLQMLGVVDAETAQMLMVAFAPITGITMQQALAKSPTSTVKKIAG